MTATPITGAGTGAGAAAAEAVVDLAAAVLRLGGLAACLFLRRDGQQLVEYPPRDDGLILPVQSTFSGTCVTTARALVADVDEDLLHPRERALMRRHDARVWLAVPVMSGDEEEADGLVVGLKTTPLSADTGGRERTVLSLAANHLAMRWRVFELEQSLASARSRARDLEGEAEGLLQSLRTAAIVLTPENRIDDANRAAELLLGFQVDAVRGRPVEEAIAHEAIVDLLRNVGATGGGGLPEVRFGEDGNIVLEVRIAPVFDGRGELRRRIVVFNDTTLLKQADELKTEFVSMISHELRTPLTSIKAFASTLLRTDVGSVEDQREWLQIIDRECDRLTALINDLLVISRLESGQRLPMQFGQFQLQPLLEDVVEAARGLATQHEFRLEVPEDLRLEADAEKLRQVFNNLLTNAVRYSPRGGEVAVQATAEGSEVRVEVSDHGVGIRPEHLNLVFDKFFQVDGSTTRRVGGTGLGLYLTRQLVEAHDGRIWAESEPGVGSTFVVVLPRRRHVRDRLGT